MIGTSWGGLDAVSRLLDGLHDDVHPPIVVVQHRSAESEDGASRDLLGHHTRRIVADADDKTPLEPDHVYLGAARLPRARRGRPPRALDGRAGAVRAAVDRRAVRDRPPTRTASARSASSSRARTTTARAASRGSRSAAASRSCRTRRRPSGARCPTPRSPRRSADAVLPLEEIPHVPLRALREVSERRRRARARHPPRRRPPGEPARARGHPRAARAPARLGHLGRRRR